MFRRILLRNLISMMVPLIIIEAMILFMAIQLASLDKFRCYNLTDLSMAEILYLEGKTNISIACPDNLKPAGFNFVSGDKVIGEYYYLLTDKGITLFILDPETAAGIKDGSKETLYVKIVKDTVSAKYVEEEYNDELGLGSDTLNGYVSEYVFDEPEYPVVKISILSYIKIIDVIIIAISFIYLVLAALYSFLNFSIRKRGIDISKAELIDVLDDELENHLVEKDGNYYVTEKYEIDAYISYIDIRKRT